MAKKTSITITTTDTNGKKTNDKIAYVNPEATNEQLVQFARMLVALTTSTYTSTTKVTEEDL